MTIAEFLLARISEDETVADRVELAAYVGDGVATPLAGRVLAECKAKRRVLKAASDPLDDEPHDYFHGARDAYNTVLSALVFPYADHPDFDPSWT